MDITVINDDMELWTSLEWYLNEGCLVGKQWGILLNAVDLEEITQENMYVLEAYVVLTDGNFEGDDTASRTEAAFNYCGGVPIDHILTHEAGNWDCIVGEFTLREAQLEKVDCKSGTLAAQEYAEFEYLKFFDKSGVMKYARLLEERFGYIAENIEEIIERPINLAGHSGARTLNTYVEGDTWSSR